MIINDRIQACRQEMSQLGLDAYIIPSSDPHQSEYVADRWKSREWISEFTGSAGVVVITQDHAGLWTDSRYFLQAEEQLATSEMVLHKVKNQYIPQHIAWCRDNLDKGKVVGVDGWMISSAQEKSYIKILGEAGVKLNTSHDVIEKIWDQRPDLPTEKVIDHDVNFAGKTREEKLAVIREKMKEKGADLYLMTALDDIAWAYNLRGNDVEFNPVFIGYGLIGKSEAILYIDPAKISDFMFASLQEDGIKVREYDFILQDLNKLDEKATILADPSQVNSVLYKGINGKIISGQSIVKWEKAIKNEVEISHIRQVMVKDGAALANTFYWMEETLKEKGIPEAELAEKLAYYRSQQPYYKGESFSAIVGYKGNGAIIHYRPMPDTCATIEKDGMLLVDSGGQYMDGTTDITRTFSLSVPTAEQKKHFTLVLRGMIALTLMKFPEGTPAGQLDTIARQFLWNETLNYGHGTGHGVGFFLNVHEPPQGFATINSERGKTAIVPGMLTSNEPGYYLEGEYGIRIENLVLAKEDETEGFIAFDTTTLYPIDLRLIDETMLNRREKAWLNRYHQEVYDKVSPLLKNEVKEWFKLKCRGLN